MAGQAVRRLTAKLIYRLYLATMRFEAMSWLPFRRWCLNRLLERKHDRLLIFPNVFIEGWEGLTLGDNVSINRGCNISAAGGLTIGDDAAIGHSTSILTTSHSFDGEGPIKEQPVIMCPVTIGRNCWIGARVVILASLPEGTIVGAGAVVTRSPGEANCTIAGVPARVMARRSQPC
jgi:acetyltransferase-like isoleucine patch superfamily enzyme